MKNNNEKVVEWDWGKELDEIDRETEKYWRDFDLNEDNTDWEKVQELSKQSFANSLRNSLGKDMNDVMTGKVKVKLPFKIKVKYWIKRIFEIFG